MLNINKNDYFICTKSVYKDKIVQYQYNEIYRSNYPNTIENKYHNDLLWNGNWIKYFKKLDYNVRIKI